jgi:hypothetical protein
MLRKCVCGVAAIVLVTIGVARADEGNRLMEASVTKVDSQKNEITVQQMNITGKEEQKTLQLARDAKLTDSMGVAEKLDAFHAGDEVFLMERGNEVTHLSKYSLATIGKIDPTANTISLNIKETNGTRAEKTFKLSKDTEYFEANGHTGMVSTYKPGDEVVFFESNGQVEALKKADTKDKMHSASMQR